MTGKTWSSKLENFKLIGLDTNLFIYHFNETSNFHKQAERVFNLLADEKIKAVTSTITLIELLSFKIANDEIKNLREAFFTTPNLKIIEIDEILSEEAARIRRNYDFRIPDSIQLATCLNLKAKAFITNDIKLKKFKELKVILISEL